MNRPQKGMTFGIYVALLIIWSTMWVLWVIRFFVENTSRWDRGDWSVYIFEGVLFSTLVVLHAILVAKLKRQKSKVE